MNSFVICFALWLAAVAVRVNAFEYAERTDGGIRHARQTRDAPQRLAVQPKEETDEELDDDENAAGEDGIKTANETDWWRDGEHKTVNHKYYEVVTHAKSAMMLDKYWQDVDAILNEKRGRGNTTHPHLSKSYRRAVSLPLSFKFPFYGHLTENITVATGGFVYVGEQVHSWLAATQYIAPLMANFDTTQVDDAQIRYADTGDMMIVEWYKVALRNQQDAGNFTFQLVLHATGDIWFLYKEIPVPVSEVSDLHHPRKVGMSDAYLLTHSLPASNRRIIYEYHRVEIPFKDVQSGVVVEIKALPVCIAKTSCEECMNSSLASFNCSWCPASSEEGGGFCSDEQGLHRRRQDWLKGCNKQSSHVYCSASTPAPKTTRAPSTEPKVSVMTSVAPRTSKSPVPNPEAPQKQPDGTKAAAHEGMSAGAVVSVLFICGAVVGVVGWLVYAYYNPHTPSGQFLIRYRPSRWRWSSHSDVRYTASVHM